MTTGTASEHHGIGLWLPVAEPSAPTRSLGGRRGPTATGSRTAGPHPNSPGFCSAAARWALLTEAETAWALGSLRSPAMGTYVLGYFHGWRLLQSWLDHPDRQLRARRLLSEPTCHPT